MADEQKPTFATTWGPMLVTSIIAVCTLTVQWGVVTTRLAGVELRLAELVAESKVVQENFLVLERRVSFLEGQMGDRID